MERSRRLGIYLPVLFIFIIASVTLRTISLFKDYIFGTGYFSDEVTISIAGITVFVGSVILLSFIFISKKLNIVPSFSGPATYVPSGILATALVFLSLELLFTIKTKSTKPLTAATLIQGENLLTIVTALLAFASIAYFLFCALYTRKENERRGLFGIILAVFLALYACYLFTDTKFPINSPQKAVDQSAFLLASLFFLFETRISLGREKWRCYCGFGMVASLLTAYSSVPTLIHYFAADVPVSDSLASAVLAFALFVYITSRVILVDFLKEDQKSKATEAVEELMKTRLEELKEPDSPHIHQDDESFNTLGKNYEFNIHVSEEEHSPDNEETTSE